MIAHSTNTKFIPAKLFLPEVCQPDKVSHAQLISYQFYFVYLFIIKHARTINLSIALFVAN